MMHCRLAVAFRRAAVKCWLAAQRGAEQKSFRRADAFAERRLRGAYDALVRTETAP